MPDESPDQARQDIVDAEYGSGYRGAGPSEGQVAFDVVFGIVTPILLLVVDPALFVASVADRAALPPYWASPAYILVGSLILALVLWGVTGVRRTILGMLLAGPFAVGALLSAFAGIVLLPFAVVHSDLVSGLLGLTPWLTAFVFLRHCMLACRAGAQRSVALTLVALTVTATLLVTGLAAVGTAAERRARYLESLLLSDDPTDVEYACAYIRGRAEVDTDRVALYYSEMKEDDPRRPGLAEAYRRITGRPVEEAVDRLLSYRGARRAPPAETAPKAKEDPTQRLVGLLFSKDYEEHVKAASDLLTHDPDPKMLEAIVQRYSELTEDDLRRAWIEGAYTSLNSDGETIKDALKRLEKKAGTKGKGAEHTPEATEPTPPAPPDLP